MVKKLNPRHGSLQFWPRKRAKSILARVRTWTGKDAKPLGFLGYKIGMAHAWGSEVKGKNTINHSIPVTLIECPPIKILSARFYQKKLITTEVLSSKLDPELKRRLKLPKKYTKKIEDIKEFDSIRILAYSQPKLTSLGKKKPEVFEIALGGNKDEQLNWVKENFEKEIPVSDILTEKSLVDIHAVTKGKGYQGVIKRFGVNLKAKKSEKGQRGVGARSGGWCAQAHMMWRVAQPGKMGFHQRTEYNKLILKIDQEMPKTMFKKYGKVRNTYIVLKGSVAGPSKRAIKITHALRPSKKIQNTKVKFEKVLL